MKEKRKNLDMVDLQAISRASKEASEAAYRQYVQNYANKVRKRLGDGKFSTDSEGKLHVGFKLDAHYDDYEFNNAVKANLQKEFADVDYSSYWFGLQWVITP